MFWKKQEIIDFTSVNKMIDFTLLDPRATYADVEKLCNIAYKNQYYAVCVQPCNVSFAKGYILQNLNENLKVVSVVGFPLGANSSEIKIQETRQALIDGADEIDVVINIGRAKELDYDYVQDELYKIKKIAKKHIVKAIIETCYFDENEIIKLCNLCVKAKIDFVKTSTGFAIGGANERQVELMVKTLQGKCYVKASGGIKNREQAIRFANLGVRRIGTSSII